MSKDLISTSDFSGSEEFKDWFPSPTNFEEFTDVFQSKQKVKIDEWEIVTIGPQSSEDGYEDGEQYAVVEIFKNGEHHSYWAALYFSSSYGDQEYYFNNIVQVNYREVKIKQWSKKYA